MHIIRMDLKLHVSKLFKCYLLIHLFTCPIHPLHDDSWMSDSHLTIFFPWQIHNKDQEEANAKAAEEAAKAEAEKEVCLIVCFWLFYIYD